MNAREERPTTPPLQWNTGAAHANPNSSVTPDAQQGEKLELDVLQRSSLGIAIVGHPEDKADAHSAGHDAQAELFSGLKGLVEAMMKASAAADRATSTPRAAAQPTMDS